MVVQEGMPKEVAESILRTAQDYEKAVDRYQKIGESDKFRAVLSDPKNAEKPLQTLQKEFNDLQWQEAKKEFSPPIQAKVSAAAENEGKHYKEIPAVQLYFAATKQGGVLDRFKQFLGADELTNVIKGAVVEDSEQGESSN